MGLPSSRNTTYIANSLPKIKAADLNQLQDAIVALVTGTSTSFVNGWSFKNLLVDGIGGQAVSLAAGVIAKFTGGMVDATGAGTDPAIKGTGGSSTGTGIQGFGGASSGRGGQFFGGASNGIGLEAFGDGTGSGVDSTGGDSNGTGVVGRGGTGNSIGVRGEPSGTGVGVSSSNHITADDGDIKAADGNLLAQGNGSDEGNVKAQGSNSGDGYLQAAGTRSSSTAGAGQGVDLGKVYKDTAPIAWAVVNGGAAGGGSGLATFVRGANISSISHTAEGAYTVTFVNGVTGGGTLAVIGTLSGSAGFIVCTPGTTNVNLTTYDTSNVAKNRDFQIVVFGGG